MIEHVAEKRQREQLLDKTRKRRKNKRKIERHQNYKKSSGKLTHKLALRDTIAEILPASLD